MIKNYGDYYITIFGLILLGTGLFFVKTLIEP